MLFLWMISATIFDISTLFLLVKDVNKYCGFWSVESLYKNFIQSKMTKAWTRAVSEEGSLE